MFNAFGRYVLTICLVLSLGLSVGCSSKGFMVIEDAPHGTSANQTLGMRYAVDSGSLSPTERYSWLELCEKVTKSSFVFFTEEFYVNCIPQLPLTAQANKTTATGWVAGIIAPVVSSGLQAGAIAFAGYQIGHGIGKTGTKVTNNNGGNTSSGNTTNATGGNATGGNATAKGGNAKATGGDGGAGGAGGDGGTGAFCPPGICKDK